MIIPNGLQTRNPIGPWRSVLIGLFVVAGMSACSTSRGFLTEEGLKTAENAYLRGDYVTALREWRPRAEKGDPEVQYGVGYMYRHGQGVSQDSKEAGRWYERAAAQGYVKAQVKLGLMYAKGDGFPQSYVQAHKWFNLAAAQGHKDAARARDKIGQSMSATEIEEALRLAREWKPNG